jgi:WD40 repeat protein
VQFCRRRQNQMVVASCGEDATVRLWDGESGTAIHVWKLGGCVLRIIVVGTTAGTDNNKNNNDSADDNDDDILVAACNMGALAVLDLRHAIPRRSTIDVPDDRPVKTSGSGILPTPSINGAPSQEGPVLLSKKKRKTLRKSVDQIVFGMTFLNADTLLVATRTGSMWTLGRDGTTRAVLWTTTSIPPDACCLAVNHHHHHREHEHDAFQVAIGTRRGIVYLQSGEMLDTSPYRAVHQLQWINAMQLLAFYATPGTAVVWSINNHHQR